MATNRNSFSNQPNMSSGGATGNVGAGQQQQLPSYYSPSHPQQKPKAGPNRSTKASGKLKILPSDPQEAPLTSNPPPTSTSTSTSISRPSATLRAKPAPSKKSPAASVPNVRPSNPLILKSHHEDGSLSSDEDDDEDDDEEGGREEDADKEGRNSVGNQLSLIPEGSMRRDARRLTRKARAKLPRVTAYSTATSYRMRDLSKFLNARRDSHRTNPMTFDECVYTTYTYEVVDAARGVHQELSPSNPPPQSHSKSGSKRSQHSNPSHSNQNQNQHAPPSPGGGNRHSSHYGRTGDLLGIPELTQEEEEGEGEGETKERKSYSKSKLTNSASSNNESESQNGSSSNDATLIGSNSNLEESDEMETKLQKEREREEFEKREEIKRKRRERFVVKGIVPEIFIMEYGTIVIWGMTLAQEKRLLRELRKFEVERLAQEDVESEDLNWYLADYSRIYNDVITLRKGSSYMTKLSLSHALAQSTKISFFEGIIDNTIETTKDIPQSIAESGKIGMPPAEIMKQIGHLFILRMNIHLVGSIVDSPEIFWAQPDLEPLYSAARSYLEIPQRIELLNTRVEVLQDMLQLLKDQVTSSHSEWLEIIVIVLIVLEIILGVATMIVDLYFA